MIEKIRPHMVLKDEQLEKLKSAFPESLDDGGDGLLFADYNISIKQQQSREILHDLFTSENVHVVIFDATDDIKLVDFSFTISPEDKAHFLNELHACYSSISDYNDNFSDETWNASIHEIAQSFRAGGAPVNSTALSFYQKRMTYKPEPAVKFWAQYNG